MNSGSLTFGATEATYRLDQGEIHISYTWSNRLYGSISGSLTQAFDQDSETSLEGQVRLALCRRISEVLEHMRVRHA